MLKEKTTMNTVSSGNSGRYLATLVSEKKGEDDKIKIQLVWEAGATSTECFEALKNNILVDLIIYAKENDLLELNGWKTLKRLTDRSKLTE